MSLEDGYNETGGNHPEIDTLIESCGMGGVNRDLNIKTEWTVCPGRHFMPNMTMGSHTVCSDRGHDLTGVHWNREG